MLVGFTSYFPPRANPRSCLVKIGASIDVIFHVFELRPVRMIRTHVIEQHGDISLQAHEDIVEIMGDPAGKRTDSLHFLDLDELILEFFLLLFSFLHVCDVRAHGENPAADIILIDQRNLVSRKPFHRRIGIEWTSRRE